MDGDKRITMENIKAVIFDLDGTLADTLPLCIESFQKAFDEVLGVKFTESELTRYFGQTEEGIVKSLAPDNWQACLDKYIEIYTKNHHICPSVFDGVYEILDFIKDNNLKSAMVTGKGEHSVYITLDYYNIRKYFEYVETGSTSGVIKDKCIEKILDRWEIPANQALYLGDQPSDITSSRKAGVLPIAVTWASTTNSQALEVESPYKTFSKTHDFINWLEKVSSEKTKIIN